MIICPNPHPLFPDDWMLVKQSEHDDHCGFIAAHWHAPELWQPTDKRLLTLAVAIHDTGSAHWEDYPLIHMDGSVGRPVSYWTIAPDEHIDLHREGVRAAREVHPYVALLISMHLVGIHRDRLHVDDLPNRWHMPEVSTPRVEAFIAEQRALQVELRDQASRALGVELDDARLMNDFKLFEAIDILSTQFSACGLADRDMGFIPTRDGGRVNMSLKRAGEWEFRVTPFPFAGARFDCPTIARRVKKRTFASHDDFREAWYAAEQVALPYACVA